MAAITIGVAGVTALAVLLASQSMLPRAATSSAAPSADGFNLPRGALVIRPSQPSLAKTSQMVKGIG